MSWVSDRIEDGVGSSAATAKARQGNFGKASGENGFPVAASPREAEIRVSERLGYRDAGAIVSAARQIQG